MVLCGVVDGIPMVNLDILQKNMPEVHFLYLYLYQILKEKYLKFSVEVGALVLLCKLQLRRFIIFTTNNFINKAVCFCLNKFSMCSPSCTL